MVANHPLALQKIKTNFNASMYIYTRFKRSFFLLIFTLEDLINRRKSRSSYFVLRCTRSKAIYWKAVGGSSAKKDPRAENAFLSTKCRGDGLWLWRKGGKCHTGRNQYSNTNRPEHVWAVISASDKIVWHGIGAKGKGGDLKEFWSSETRLFFVVEKKNNLASYSSRSTEKQG